MLFFEFDHKPGTFCAFGEDADALRVLGALLQEAWRDRFVLREYIG
ncbi:Imm51 family immunity protein [Kitasatospora sp. NPDC096204]